MTLQDLEAAVADGKVDTVLLALVDGGLSGAYVTQE